MDIASNLSQCLALVQTLHIRRVATASALSPSTSPFDSAPFGFAQDRQGRPFGRRGWGTVRSLTVAARIKARGKLP